MKFSQVQVCTLWACLCTRSTSNVWDVNKGFVCCAIVHSCHTTMWPMFCTNIRKSVQRTSQLCSCLPGDGLTTPFTNSVRKRRSFSDVNSWRSYEQCLFFSCFVRSVHVNMGVRMNVRMPVGLASTTLPISCRTSLCLMGSTFPSFLNICMSRSLWNPQTLLTTLNATSFWMFGTFGTRTNNQLQRLRTSRRTWSCKGLPRLSGNHPENCQSASYLHH